MIKRFFLTLNLFVRITRLIFSSLPTNSFNGTDYASVSGKREGLDGRFSREHYEHFVAISRETRVQQRATLVDLHKRNQIGDITFRKLERELDIVECE